MGAFWRQIWRDQRGSSVAQSAAVALLAAALIAVLLGSAQYLGPAAEDAFECVVSALGGGGSCAPGAGGVPGVGGSSWWDGLWDAISGAWDWLWDNVLAPIGDAIKTAWDWLWQERTAQWWADFLNWLRDKGPLGWLGAAALGFLADFLFGLGSDGKFSWGGVILSTLLTVAAFFTGGLTKIPAVARFLGKAGQLLAWIKGTRVFQWLAGTKFGQWLAKIGVGGIGDLLDGKFGTVIKEVLLGIENRFPAVKKLLDTVIFGTPIRKLIEPVGNYIWRLVKDGPFGLAKDVIGKLITKFAPSWVKEVFERLGGWKEWQGVWDWIRDPKLPWPFSR